MYRPSKNTLESLRDAQMALMEHNAGINVMEEVKRKELIFKLAIFGGLPIDFDQWGMMNDKGQTVAHAAVLHNMLPPYFDQWYLTDSDGQTVAHVAASKGFITPGFDQWRLINYAGQSVRDVYEKWEASLK